MRSEVIFNHMERSEALEQYALDKVNSVVDVHLHHHDAHVIIYLISVHSRGQRGIPEFKCEIEVRYPPKRTAFVAKSSDDMYLAIDDASSAIRQILREEGKKEIHRRNDPGFAPEEIPSTDLSHIETDAENPIQ